MNLVKWWGKKALMRWYEFALQDNQSRVKWGWIPSSQTVTIAGRTIGGLVYIGRSRDESKKPGCRSMIDRSLRVAKGSADKAGDHMPYYPCYSDIHPQCRAAYCDWLASGRSDASYSPGYIFLYFYGLEWRFFIDQPDETEKQEILHEVCRLKALYPNNRSVQHYLGAFIEFVHILLRKPLNDETVFGSSWKMLKVRIGEHIGQGNPLSAEWALALWLGNPERQERIIANRCAQEFEALFKLRFNKQFPKGLKVNKAPDKLKITYEAAAGDFQA